jgi:hypothetical protein
LTEFEWNLIKKDRFSFWTFSVRGATSITVRAGLKPPPLKETGAEKGRGLVPRLRAENTFVPRILKNAARDTEMGDSSGNKSNIY